LILTVFMPGETLTSCECRLPKGEGRQSLCSWRKYDSAHDANKICMRNCHGNYYAHCIYPRILPDSIRARPYGPSCKCVAGTPWNNGNLGNNGNNGNNGDKFEDEIP